MQDLQFIIGDVPVVLKVEHNSDGMSVRLPTGTVYKLSNVRITDSTVAFSRSPAGLDGSRRRSHELEVPFAEIGDAIVFSWQGNTYRFERQRIGAAPAPAADVSGSISAPTGGVVADLLVAVGQEVEAYEPIAVIEAMKVMTPIEAPAAGRVAELFVERGQRIEQGAVIARVEPTGHKPSGH
jgi:biotin carboxyl carrier protein